MFYVIIASYFMYCIKLCINVFVYFKMQVATCVMVGAISDLLARIALAVYTYFYNVDSRFLFFIGTTITIFLRIGKSSLIFFELYTF